MVLLGEKGNSPFSCLRFPSLTTLLALPSFLLLENIEEGYFADTDVL